MSYVLAFVGFAALIVLHEFGHFAAAKAVGMRVERFALFFPPLLLRVRRGETEYGIGAIPLGGYVRITGMNPTEEIPPEVAHRAYYRQPVWKRIVVIMAGPAVNLMIAFGLLFAIFATSDVEPTNRVAREGLRPPASRILRPGDAIVSVDGRTGDIQALRDRIASHGCAGRPREGCVARTPARLVVERGGRRLTFLVRPRYHAAIGRTAIGFVFAGRSAAPVHAAGLAVSQMAKVTVANLTAIAKIFDPQQRKQLGSVVGAYKVTQESFGFSVAQALYVLGVISLALAIINLFPFLPLDGGHVFWALAEKVRGRAIPFSVMERAGVVGFVLVLFLFFIGLSNDIGRLSSGGLQLR